MFNFCYFIRYLINEIIILKAVLMQIDPLHFLFFFFFDCFFYSLGSEQLLKRGL